MELYGKNEEKSIEEDKSGNLTNNFIISSDRIQENKLNNGKRKEYKKNVLFDKNKILKIKNFD